MSIIFRKKSAKKFKWLVFASALVPFLCACGGSKNIVWAELNKDYPDVLHVGEVDFSKMKYDVTYSNGVKEQIPVTRSMVEESDLYKFYQVGEWKVRFNYDKFYSIADFTIIENTFSDDIKLVSSVESYDGQAHSLVVSGPVPEGTTIYYPEGNSFTEASSIPYEISAVLVKEGYTTKTLKGSLTIVKSNYSQEKLDNIKFEDTTYIYDGTAKTIEATNVPSDIRVEYFIDGIEGNKKTDAGIYTVTAKLTCINLNYLPIDSLKAVLTIQKAKYDTSKLKFESKTFGFDGDAHSLKVEGLETLPGDVKVSYKDNDQINAGEYNVVASFEGNSNFEDITPMNAKLIINKEDIDLGSVQYNLQEVQYDGLPHEFTNIEGDVHSDLLKVVKKYFIEDDSEAGLTEVDEAIEVGIYRVVISYEFLPSINPSNYSLINVPTKNGILIIEASE